MKIVNRKIFLQMPKGTLFSEYVPCVFYGLFAKTGEPDDMINDYFEKELISNPKCHDSGEFSSILINAEETGASFNLDFDISGRNGAFKNDQLYAVYEKQDIVQLIHTLQACI